MNDVAITPAALRALLDGVESHLAQEKADGTRRVEVSPETLQALRTPVVVSAAATPPAARRNAPSPVPARQSRGKTLEDIAAEIAQCTKCPLSRTRTLTVPGHGNPRAKLMFIGEAPGTEEDRQGLPFVGRAGELLNRMIKRMGFAREEVFVANIAKCRPTENYEMQRDRPPTEEEMNTCIPFLEQQIDAIQPQVIVALGATAVFGLIRKKGITKLRGHWFSYRGIPVMPTYHPAYLLRGGGDEKARYWEVWEDMQAVLTHLGRPIPPKS